MNFSDIFNGSKTKFFGVALILALGAGTIVSGCSEDKGDGTQGQSETRQSNTETSDSTHNNGEKEADAQAAAGQAAAPMVIATKVTKKDIHYSHEWPAETKSGDEVNVQARIEGTLENFSFKEGMEVKEGQVLFTIDDAQYQAALQAAQAQVSKAKADLEYAKTQVNVRKAEADLVSAQTELNRAQQDVDRYKPLVASGTIARQILDNAVAQRDVAQAQVNAANAILRNTRLSDKANIDIAAANLEAARANVTQAELNIGYCTITSPISGVIGKLNVYPGNLVGSVGNTQPLVTISKLDPMYVTFSLTEKEYLYIMDHRNDEHGGVDIELILSDGKVYPHKGSFNMLERTLDSATGTIGVRMVFPNPDFILREGQFGRLRITARDAEKVLVVPQKAIMTVQSDRCVYVVGANNIVESRTVTLGTPIDDNYTVESGLKEGETIIVDGLQKVKPGSPCNPSVTEERPVINP
ncbi:efflux RND transporter periplasmic adaptor subunit [bacterium]|nr:efflux RND transporter periplasmic adaptor subunit [bacterium]